MSSSDNLVASARAFIHAINSLPESLFLAQIDEWTPRDVTAHLVWWNRNMMIASENLRAHQTPAYHTDAANDYRNLNTHAIAEFPSTDRRELLAQLDATLDELTCYLAALAPAEWDAEHGIQHYRGGAATIRRIVQSLTGDYEHHTHQILNWKTIAITNLPGELFDIVDERNNVIGQELRTVAHRRGLWHRSVNVFLFTRDGKLLVQRRSKTKETFPGALDCSVGEHARAGEICAQTAVRGLQEEVGVAGIELTPLMEFIVPSHIYDNEIGQLYEGIVEPADVRFDPGEIENVAYYSLDELLARQQSKSDSYSRWFEQLLLWYLNQPNELIVRRIDQPKRLGKFA